MTEIDQITIEGKKVDIKWKPWLIRGKRRVFGFYSAATFVRPRITIDEGQPLRERQVTLMHELLHHCVRLSKSKMPLAQEEEFCDAVDVWLAQAIRENPKLVEFLTRVP